MIEILEGYLHGLHASEAGSHQRTSPGEDGWEKANAARSADDLPQTLEEACALLNVTPETPQGCSTLIFWERNKGIPKGRIV